MDSLLRAAHILLRTLDPGKLNVAFIWRVEEGEKKEEIGSSVSIRGLPVASLYST